MPQVPATQALQHEPRHLVEMLRAGMDLAPRLACEVDRGQIYTVTHNTACLISVPLRMLHEGDIRRNRAT